MQVTHRAEAATSDIHWEPTEAMDAHAPTPEPTVTLRRDGDDVTLEFAGPWTVGHAEVAERDVRALKLGAAKGLTFDLSGIVTADTAGAWIVHRERASAEYAGKTVTLTGASERMKFLLEEIEKNIPRMLDRPRRPYAFVRLLTGLGETAHFTLSEAAALLSMLGIFGFRLITAFTSPQRLRLTAVLSNFDKACRGAVPIVILMSFIVGLIIAQQGGYYLLSFGAAIFVVDLSGVLILRELGVLLAAVLVAGRSGSAFTAEIGSMRMREEIDALHVLGLDPVEVLVVPRLMALMLALPILAFLSDGAALAGACIITWVYLGITPEIFFTRLQEVITPIEFYIGIAKAPFMALIIGLVGCNEGLKVGGSSESLGRQTTASVVKAIFLVIVVDGLFAVFFATVGI